MNKRTLKKAIEEAEWFLKYAKEIAAKDVFLIEKGDRKLICNVSMELTRDLAEMRKPG
jgi:hypothetical protein